MSVGFSIIIPLYNKEDYVGDTLESVRAQEHEDYEVVVVDDGSTDGGPALVESYAAKDPRIRLITQTNGGVSVARNRGMAEAHGGYYAFLDADDTWEPEHLSEIVALSESYPEAALLGTAYQRCFNSGPSASIVLVHLEGKGGLIDDYFKYVAQAQFIYTSSIAVAAWSIDEIGGFPEGVRNGEDLDLWTRLALQWPVAYSGKVTVNYACGVAGQATGATHGFSTQYPMTLGAIYAGSGLGVDRRKYLNLIGARLALGVAGKFFCQRTLRLEACFGYLNESGLFDWVKCRRLSWLRRWPVPIIWRVYFNFCRIGASRRYLRMCGGSIVRSGVKFELKR